MELSGLDLSNADLIKINKLIKDKYIMFMFWLKYLNNGSYYNETRRQYMCIGITQSAYLLKTGFTFV